MQKLVRLWKRPSRDGKLFTYILIYTDENGKTRYESLGHTDRRKAERQRAQKERELRMGVVEPGSLKLREFLEDHLTRTRGQVRESTLTEAKIAMKQLIEVVGNLDYRSIHHRHGERLLQACLDKGNAPATAAKKLRHLKRLFELAVDRGQLDENPLRRVKEPKMAKKQIHVFPKEQCTQMIQTAREFPLKTSLSWDLLIHLALSTGMRRGELLNLIWSDIDFAQKTVGVNPKTDTPFTWEWHIKDTDRRTLPLTDALIQMLATHQATQPDGYPYVFVPPDRYDHIQRRRQQGKWSVDDGRCPINNFSVRFRSILKRAGIKEGEFHDLRRTCLSNWLGKGLSEFDVMNLAGHSCFETTRRFYLAVREDLLERARQATDPMVSENFIAHSLRAPSEAPNDKRLPIVTD